MVEEQNNQINYLKELLEIERSKGFAEAQIERIPRDMPKGINNRKTWQQQKIEIQERMRLDREKENANRATESPD